MTLPAAAREVLECYTRGRLKFRTCRLCEHRWRVPGGYEHHSAKCPIPALKSALALAVEEEERNTVVCSICEARVPLSSALPASVDPESAPVCPECAIRTTIAAKEDVIAGLVAANESFVEERQDMMADLAAKDDEADRLRARVAECEGALRGIAEHDKHSCKHGRWTDCNRFIGDIARRVLAEGGKG